MISRHVLAAIALGVSTSDEDVARTALARIDPVIRPFARRRFERAMIDAALACDASGLPNAPADHVMRLAGLQIAGTPSGEVANPSAVAVAYAALRMPSLSRLPIVTLIVALVTAALAGAIVFHVATRPGPPPRTYARALPPPSAKAFELGGTPLKDPAIDALLREELTTLVVEGNRLGANDREILLKKVRTPQPVLARGADLAKAWDAMLDAFEGAVAISHAGQVKPQTQDLLREAVREVSAAFIRAGLGYHLEGRFRRAFPIIQAYAVEQVVFVKTNAAPRRVLSLRRLDRLNTSWAVLGMHDEDAGDPTLHLDRIDVNVATFVLPVLAGGRPYRLGDKEWMLWDKNKAIATAIGDVIRKEYAGALGADAEKAQTIASLLVKRGDIIDEWRDKLGRRDMYFITIDRLFVPPSLIASLDGQVPNSQRRKVTEIDATLAELEAPRIHARIHDLIAATVRRHEAQHGFDYDRDTELRYPQALADLLGSPHDGEGNERSLVRSARAELSAYLSQTLNDPLTPHASFWHLVRNTFDRNDWGSGEFYAALVAIEGIAKQLGADTSTPRRKGGEFDRERVSAFSTRIAGTSSEKLRAAVRTLWTELYGEPPTEIIDMPPPAVTGAAP